jgi:flagellar basal-body rod modification protein FlgD
MNTYEINSRNSTAATARNGSTARAGSKELERDNFMELLLLQLRSQDPMSPMDSAAMFNQMAQLSMLEQLWDIRDMLSESTASQQLTQGATLIGRQVEANSLDIGRVSGLVESVRMQSGSVWLQIGNSEVRIDEVLSVE